MTEDEKKKQEIELAWQEHKQADAEEEADYREDLKKYHRVYRKKA